MQQVEAAIREDDGLARGAPVGDPQLDAFEVEDLFARGQTGAWRQYGDKFVCGKKLYNYDSLEPSERKLVL